MRTRRKLVLVILAASAPIAVWLMYRSHSAGVFLSSDSDCLARVIRSEIGVGTPKQRLHVAWAARNLAAEKGLSLAKLACSPVGPQGRSRPLSSIQPATPSDSRVARKVLALPSKRDPTRGATHFINPRLQNKFARTGTRPGYKGRSYRKIRRRWKRMYGWEPYYRLGPTLEMWGPARKIRKKRRGS